MSVSKFVLILVLVPGVFLLVPRAISAQTAGSATNGIASEEDEANLHGRAWMRLIESDLISEKFDDLDRMAAQLRREKSRFPGGEWKLVYFYSALDKPELTDKDTLEHLAHLRHWIAQRPESITARVALATSLHRWAWVARGNGMAGTVTQEGWKLFGERIQESMSVLAAAANLHEQCPQWYSEMMIVGLAQSWNASQMREVFEQGIQFEPGYFRLYKQYANYLLPKWDGKPGDATAFAKTSADNLGGEEGDQIYFHIATAIIGKNGADFGVKEMDWPRIQRGYQAIAAQYGNTAWLKNEIAFMAWKFKDSAFARQQFDLIGDHWSSSVWRDRQRFDRARDWAQSND